MSFLSDNKLYLIINQHGFRTLCSCVTELLQLVHEWLSILDEHGSVDAIFIFLDFAKAFNKVSHQHLLLKCQHHGIKGQYIYFLLLEWISDFLTKISALDHIECIRSYLNDILHLTNNKFIIIY